jgi:hypothetical protein
MRRRALVILIAAAALVGGPNIAFACTCALQSPHVYATNATVVFTGVVTSVNGFPLGLVCSSTSPVAVTFDVETVYKGDVPRAVTVHTVSSGASCGYTFETGKRYTVFPRMTDGKLDTGLCNGNVEGTIAPSEYGFQGGRPPGN